MITKVITIKLNFDEAYKDPYFEVGIMCVPPFVRGYQKLHRKFVLRDVDG